MSDCNVCLGDYDGEQAEFYAEAMVKARTPHRCYECRREISPQSMYERVTGKWDGEFSTYSFCVECSDIGKAFSCGGGRLFGTLWDDVREYLFPEMTTGCLEKLTEPSAKQYLLDQWREWKGL